MIRLTQKLGGKALLRIAALTAAGIGVSGCVYDVGLGYASDDYGSSYYDCDPYGGYDRYYDCDYGHGFYNIGYGGGWYNDYWYPGYGFYLFDNGGRRYAMRDNDRRYWGERRHNWYRENRGRHDGGGRHESRGSGYSDNGHMAPIGWPERNGGRVRDGERGDRNRGDGHPDHDRDRGQNRGWQGGNGNGANAIPTPIPTPEAARGEDYSRGEGRRGRGGGRPDWRGNDGAGAVQTPRSDQPMGRPHGRQEGEGRPYRQPPAAADYSRQSTQQSAPTVQAEQPRQPRSAGPRPGRGYSGYKRGNEEQPPIAPQPD
jgi:hypothetical protein